MSSPLAAASLRHLLRHPWQLGLSVLGVALGVAVVVAIDLANASARRAFLLAGEAVAGRATHRVVGPGGELPEEVYRRLRVELGVRESAPVVEASIALPAAPGRSFTLLGIDPFAESGLRPHLAVAGEEGFDIAGFLTLPGAAVLAASTARELGVAPGEELAAEIAGRERTLRVVGTLEGRRELSRRALADLVAVDLATAQELLERPGMLTRIDLVLPQGEAGAALERRIARVLPPAARVEPVSSRARTLSELTRAFRLNLTALGLLALLCGAFLIYNAMTFSVVQRRGLIGLLRSLGVTRRQVFTLVLGEAAVVGAAGTAAGLALGAALSRALVGLVARTIDDLYLSLSVTGVTTDPLSLAKGAVLGVGASVLAALAPAREAAGATPRAAWSRSLLEERRRRGAGGLAAGGTLLAAAGAGLLALPWGGVAGAFAGLAAVLLGCALLVPLCALLFARLCRPPAGRLGGLVGRMAAGGIAATLSRTAVAAASLMIAVSVSAGVGMMIASFRGSVARWLEGTLVADVYAGVPGDRFSPTANALDRAFADRVRRLPGVVRVNTLTGLTVSTAVGPTRLQAIDLDHRSRGAFDLVAGDPEAAWEALLRGDAALVSEPFAFRSGLGVGDALTLPTDRGEKSLPIAGVYADFSSDRGVITLGRAAFERFWRPRGFSVLGIFAAPGTDLEALVTAVRGAAADAGMELVVRSSRGLREASLEVFDRTFRITGVLRLLAGLVAFIGVLAALLALELERSREVAVLRAQGLTPAQVWGLITAESGLLGLLAGLLAVPAGVATAAIMTAVINRRSFGWSLTLELEPAMLLTPPALAVVAALLAGLYPAWRMARTPPAAALRDE